MKKILLLLFLITGLSNAQIINFPDANFKARLLFASENFQIASTQTPDINGEGITEYTAIDTNGNGEIEVSEAMAIKYLVVYTDPFSNSITDITGIEFFQGLVGLRVRSTDINSLPINNLGNLVYLDCSDNNTLNNLDLSNLINLKTLNCYGIGLTSINLSPLINLQTLDCSFNTLTSLDVSNLNSLNRLTCSFNQLTNLNLAGLTNLQYLDCSINQISNLNLTDQVNLLTLGCGYNLLTSLNLTNQVNLQNLSCSDNQLTSFDTSNLPSLINFNCARNQIISLNLDNLTHLTQVDCSFNLITSIVFNNLPQMERLFCSNNHLASLDVTNLNNLLDLRCNNNQLQSIDLNSNVNLDIVNFMVNPLHTVFMKNGHSQYFPFSAPLRSVTDQIDILNTPVEYICADELESNYWQNIFQNTIICNDYCAFDPTGNYNVIDGIVIFDVNNNGCDANDLPITNVRININDGTQQGSAFTINSGNYNFYTQAGSFTLTPSIDNPTWFTFSPPSATVDFIDNYNNNAAQNFCITSNGIHNDVEIIIAPTVPARPGFDATYEIVYKNKGNLSLSGDINFGFDDTRLDYVSSTQTPNTQSTGNINWSYTNLLPFESRSFNVILNVNTPTETPSVNIGDQLDFTATINPIVGDELPNDNNFNFNQTVVGSFDPNNKICLQGNVAPTSKIGDYLHYTINFENTGTAAATFVVVKDLIDTTKFDINSLQIMNSSHPMTTRITENKVEFIFENINLGSNEHGNVTFKIKTKNTLVEGNTVTNKADIYFDYNFPIETNIASTTFQTLSSGEFEMDGSVVIAPNPTKSTININCNTTIQSIQLFDVQGRVLTTQIVNETQSQLDISNYTKGIYFVKVTTEKGDKIEKIIKE